MLIVLGLFTLVASGWMGFSIGRDFRSEKTEALVLKNHVEHSTSSKGIKRKEHFAEIKYTYQGQEFLDKIFQKSRKKAGETILICRRQNSINEYYPLKDFVIFAIALTIGLITLALILKF